MLENLTKGNISDNILLGKDLGMKVKNSLYINVTITEYILQNLKYRADWQIYTKTVKK